MSSPNFDPKNDPKKRHEDPDSLKKKYPISEEEERRRKQRDRDRDQNPSSDEDQRMLGGEA